jgi:hypothetical protein
MGTRTGRIQLSKAFVEHGFARKRALEAYGKILKNESAY